MKEPKVSVIIPIYNVENYLVKCMESVQNQTFDDIEIIAVNDGSTDGSRRLLDEMKLKDDRIIIVDKKNEGLSSARNVGIDIAKGEYIAFIDSDDWVDKEYIKRMYDVCVDYGCDIVQCSYEDIFVYQDSSSTRQTSINSVPTFYTGREFCYAMYTLLSWRCNLTWNKLYKKSLFDNIRFPYGKIHEDEFTTYKIIWSAKKIATISDRLYYYRYRKGSIMNESYDKKRLHASEAYTERENFFENQGEIELLYLAKKYHRDWIVRQKSIVKKMPNDSKKDYMMTYLDSKEVELVQNMDRLGDSKVNRIGGSIFPFSRIKKGSSIILYGGGHVGRQYYRQVYMQNYCNIVLWVDKNAEECRTRGIPVESIEHISGCNCEWDYIVIAIKDRQIVYDIIQMLMKKYSIPANKIICEIS